MRQIYTSPRPENIERVVQLLAEHGIETTVTNRRVYQRPSYNRFSYSARDSGEDWPKVWITRAEDQTRAREVLREIGIEPATRYASELAAQRRPGAAGPGHHAYVASRVRTALVAAVGAMFVLLVLKMMGVF